LSPGTYIENVYTKLILPFFANYENGLSVHAGYFFKENQSVEVRVSYGTAAKHSHFTQIYTGYHYYLYKKKLFTGINLRLIENYNDLTEEHYFHIAPFVNFGWRWTMKELFYIDTRLNWDFAAISWSTVEHSEVGVGLMIVPPALSMNIGCDF